LSVVLAGFSVLLAVDCVTPSGPDPVGRLVGRTNCKNFGARDAGAAAAPTSSQECVEYRYDGRSVLTIKHVNAGFNCCPGTITADIRVEGGAIRIKESESSSLCDCNCLYDVDYEIANLAPGAWRISVTGPYQSEDDPPLEFFADLRGEVSAAFCVARTHYPWGY
jgi:hypothetical protein